MGVKREGERDLRQTLEQLEQKTRELSEQLRGPVPDPATGDKLKAELRDTVRQAFQTRQKLQRAELAEFAQRLQRIQQSIEMRERIAEQIIDRRVDELLDPNLKWEDATQDVSCRAPALGTSGTTPSRDASPEGSRHAVASGKVELTDLQGNWRLISTSIDTGKNEAGRIKHVVKNATITGNRISVTSHGEVIPTRFVLHLDGNASPQAIDLEHVLSTDEQIEIQDSLEAYSLRDGKPVALGIVERFRRGFRICVCNEDMKKVGRPHAFELGETAEIWEFYPM